MDEFLHRRVHLPGGPVRPARPIEPGHVQASTAVHGPLSATPVHMWMGYAVLLARGVEPRRPVHGGGVEELSRHLLRLADAIVRHVHGSHERWTSAVHPAGH